jgi:hypothetical protein
MSPISVKTKVRVGHRPPTTRVVSPIDRAKAHEVDWEHVVSLFEAYRTAGASFVYVIGEAAGPVKIGVGKDPLARLRTMQTGNPRRLRLERAVVGWQPEEALLHEIWRPFAICADGERHLPGSRPRTEWFNAEARELLLAVIATATELQVEHAATHEEIHQAQLRKLIIRAHSQHGATLHGHDEIRRLPHGPGYRVTRRSGF